MKRYRIQYLDEMALEVEGSLESKGGGIYWVCSSLGQPILQFDLEEVSTVEELVVAISAPDAAVPVAA